MGIKMKIGKGVPASLIELCMKDGRVTGINNEGRSVGGQSDYINDYWLQLREGYNWDGCGSVHESTVEQCRQALSHVTVGCTSYVNPTQEDMRREAIKDLELENEGIQEEMNRMEVTLKKYSVFTNVSQGNYETMALLERKKDFLRVLQDWLKDEEWACLRIRLKSVRANHEHHNAGTKPNSITGVILRQASLFLCNRITYILEGFLERVQ